MKKISILPFIVSLLMAGCSSGTVEQKDTEDAGSASPGQAITGNSEVVKTLKLQKQLIARSIEYSSNIMAFEEVHLAPSSPGRIEKIFVEVSDHVKKGDVLVQMDRTQLHQAIIQLKNIETDFLRLDTLNKVGSISEQRYDQVKTQYDIAKSNVQFLQENTTLMAPFDGVISGKYYEDGELYSGAPNTPAGKAAILSLVQIDPLKIMVNISEKYYPMVKNGMSARVISDLYPEKVITGKVLRIYPTLDQASRTFSTEIKIDNKESLLRPGMFCRATMDLGEEMALVVPAIAVLKMQGSNERYLFLEKNGIAHRVVVNIGKRFDDKLEIISDELKEGDNLIISGQARLVDGDKVSVTAD